MEESYRLSKKLHVFLRDDYIFSQRRDGEKMRIVVKNQNMMIQSNDDREYSVVDVEDITMSVVLRNKRYLIVDVTSYQGKDVRSIPLDRRVCYADDLVSKRADLLIGEMFDFDTMMELYFEKSRDFVFRHRYTEEIGVLEDKDFLYYFYYLERVEHMQREVVDSDEKQKQNEIIEGKPVEEVYLEKSKGERQEDYEFLPFVTLSEDDPIVEVWKQPQRGEVQTFKEENLSEDYKEIICQKINANGQVSKRKEKKHIKKTNIENGKSNK